MFQRPGLLKAAGAAIAAMTAGLVAPTANAAFWGEKATPPPAQPYVNLPKIEESRSLPQGDHKARLSRHPEGGGAIELPIPPRSGPALIR